MFMFIPLAPSLSYVSSLSLTHSLSLSLSSLSLSLSPEEDPVIKQFGEEVANEENLFAELQTASGIDQIITENEKLITEKWDFSFWVVPFQVIHVTTTVLCFTGMSCPEK